MCIVHGILNEINNSLQEGFDLMISRYDRSGVLVVSHVASWGAVHASHAHITYEALHVAPQGLDFVLVCHWAGLKYLPDTFLTFSAAYTKSKIWFCFGRVFKWLLKNITVTCSVLNLLAYSSLKSAVLLHGNSSSMWPFAHFQDPATLKGGDFPLK